MHHLVSKDAAALRETPAYIQGIVSILAGNLEGQYRLQLPQDMIFNAVARLKFLLITFEPWDKKLLAEYHFCVDIVNHERLRLQLPCQMPRPHRDESNEDIIQKLDDIHLAMLAGEYDDFEDDEIFENDNDDLESVVKPDDTLGVQSTDSTIDSSGIVIEKRTEEVEVKTIPTKEATLTSKQLLAGLGRDAKAKYAAGEIMGSDKNFGEIAEELGVPRQTMDSWSDVKAAKRIRKSDKAERTFRLGGQKLGKDIQRNDEDDE